MPSAKLRAKVDRYSFLVRLLPPLLHTGLTRRTNISISLIEGLTNHAGGDERTSSNLLRRGLVAEVVLGWLLSLPSGNYFVTLVWQRSDFSSGRFSELSIETMLIRSSVDENSRLHSLAPMRFCLIVRPRIVF